MAKTIKNLPLRRYTNLAQALYTLRHRKIVLMDPNNWDDKNDSFYLSVYRERINAKVLSALCFARGVETYHHWGIFSRGSDGICINFNRSKLLAAFQEIHGFRYGPVKYKTFKQMNEKKLLLKSCLF